MKNMKMGAIRHHAFSCCLLFACVSNLSNIVVAWSPIGIRICSSWTSRGTWHNRYRPIPRSIDQPYNVLMANKKNVVVPLDQKRKNSLERATQPKRNLDHIFDEKGVLQTVPEVGGDLKLSEDEGELVVADSEEEEELYVPSERRMEEEVAPTQLVNKLNQHLLEEWRVLLHNDEINTFNHVETSLVQVVPHMILSKAKLIANTVHEDGVGTVIAVMKPIAEKISMALQSFGLTTTTAPDKNFES